MIGFRNKKCGIQSNAPARVHEDVGGSLITQFNDVGVKKWAVFKTPQESPYPETTYTYGKQLQAGAGTNTFLLGVNGNLHSSTHGNPMPWDFSLKWLACRVIPFAPPYTYDIKTYNNGSLVATFSFTDTQPEYAFTDTPMDQGNLSFAIQVTSLGVSAFTNPILTVGVRRRF